MINTSFQLLAVTLVILIWGFALQSTLGFGPCPEGYNGNVRNPLNCSTYHSCTPYGPQIMPCPDNLCYNEDKDWCDWCSEVPACFGEISTTTEQHSEGTTTVKGSEGTTTHKSSEGTTTTKDSEETTETNSGKVTTTEKYLMCELPSFSSYSYPIFFQYPEYDCSKFYYCNMRGKYGGVGYCAKDLWFDFEIQSCTEPWSSHCHFKEL